MSMKKLTTMALLVAVSVISVVLVHIPFPPAPFLEYDPADIPILIGSCLFGPLSGLILTLVASLIQGMTVSVGSGLYGILMHVVSTGAFVSTVGLIYWRKNTASPHRRPVLRLIIALACGVLAMTAVMILANLLITPLFLGTTREEVVNMLLPIILPFNLMKAGINAIVTFPIYFALDRIFIGKGFFHDSKNIRKNG